MVEIGTPVPELPARLGMMALTPGQMLAMTLVLPMTLILSMVRLLQMELVEGTSRAVGKFSEITIMYPYQH